MPANKTGPFSSDPLLSTWLSALQAQSDLWRSAWQNMLARDYGPNDLLRDLASANRLHQDALRSLFDRQPASTSSPGSSAWLSIEVSTAQLQRGALRGKAKTSRFDPEPELHTTELTRADAQDFRFKMEATAVSSEHVLVEISDALTPGSNGKYRSLALNEAFKDPRVQGSYLGLVTHSKVAASPPLAIVNLLVRG